MRTSILNLVFFLFSFCLFGQNENPYKEFGYEAPIMPESNNSVVQDKITKFYIINTDTISSIGMLAIDITKRNVTFLDKKGLILKVDSFDIYSTARWFSVDPKRQYSSPYIGMGNNPISGVDPDGAYTRVGAFLRSALYGGGSIYRSGDGAKDWGFSRQTGSEMFGGQNVPTYSHFFGREGEESLAGAAWNHSVTRAYIPDYVGISFFNVQGVAGLGGSIDFDLMWTLRGNEASWKPLIAASPSLGVGAEAGITVGVNAYSYLGDAHDIERGFLETNSFDKKNPTIGGYGSISLPVIKGGISVTLSPAKKSYLLGRQYNIGVGIGGGSAGVFNTYILHDFYKK